MLTTLPQSIGFDAEIMKREPTMGFVVEIENKRYTLDIESNLKPQLFCSYEEKLQLWQQALLPSVY